MMGVNFIFLWNKKSTKFVKHCAFILLCPSLLLGGTGTEIFEFLRLPNGARCAALSGCSIGIIDDPFAIFSNPAGLHLDTRTLGFTYTRYIAEIQGGCGTYTLPALGGTIGTGVSYLNFGEIPRTDVNGIEYGTFAPQSLMSIFGYTRAKGNSRMGLTTKIIYLSIDTLMSVGVAADFGYLFYPKQWEGLVIGGTIQNVGIQVVKFDETEEPLPIFARLGASYPFVDKLVRASVELDLPATEVILGVEWRPSKILAIRGGYYSWGKDLKVGSDLDIFAGKSVGIGVTAKKFHLDYALTPMVDLGLVHRISLIRSFPEISKKVEKKPEQEKVKELEEKPEEEMPEEEQEKQTPEE